MSKEFKEYFARISYSLAQVADSSILSAFEILSTAIKSNSTVFIVGNGGSAATASHFATDIGKTLNKFGKHAKAISLCDNSSVITAISNDLAFEEVFRLQLETLANSNDVLVAISASGNSKNLVRAINYANENNIGTLSMTGFTGGELSKISKVSLHVPTEEGDYGVAEDAHSMLCHFLSEQLRKK
jgi:D-sedoheptulose 7-phosphate isomerase